MNGERENCPAIAGLMMELSEGEVGNLYPKGERPIREV